jgi:hypothetical protein
MQGGTASMAVSRSDKMFHHANSNLRKTSHFELQADDQASCASGAQPFWSDHSLAYVASDLVQIVHELLP